MTKIAIIGAGSGVFAHRMVVDILAIDGLGEGEFALVDIDTERLELGQQITELTIQQSGKPWTVSATTDRQAVLPGCDFVISTIEVAGVANVLLDYEIPKKYGVDQCIGDTIGPGGIFKFLRTAPTWIDILRDIEALCPDAIVMNYSNPMSALVLSANRASNVQMIGLCHSVQGTSKQIARYINISHEEMAYTCGGINHLSFFTQLESDGKDLYPLLFAAAKKEDIYAQDPIRFEMMLHFGLFVTESSGHFSEYVPYFRKRPDLIKQYTGPRYLGESGFYARNWPEWRAKHDAELRNLISQVQQGKSTIDMTRSHEYASYIIEAKLLNKSCVIYGNVANTCLIENLPTDSCVEVACLVNNSGIQPLHFGHLPSPQAAIIRSHMAVHDLMAQAVLDSDREAAVHALMLDPLTAAVLSPAEIRQLFDEMAFAQAVDLPPWMHEQPKVI